MRKLWLISKFITSQTGQQIITMHILPNISRIKGNQTKFAELIKCNMINHTQNVVEKLILDSFIKNKIGYISGLTVWNVRMFLFQVKINQNILKLSCWPRAFTFYKTFLKNKKKSGTSLPTCYPAWFLKKIFLTLHFVNCPNLIPWLLLLPEILDNMCIVTNCFPVCEVINLEINHSFLIRPFFCKTKKSTRKCKYLKNERAFNTK